MNLKKICASLLLGSIVMFSAFSAEAGSGRFGIEATPGYWLSRTTHAQEVILTPEQISAQNQDLQLRDTSLIDLTASPDRLPGREVRQHIMAAMQDFWQEKLPEEYVGGELLTWDRWQQARRNCNLADLPEEAEAEYAVTVQRAALRLLPVSEAWNDEPDEHYDDLQGTVLDPAEAVLIWHRSLDGKFAFVQAEDYQGWVSLDSLALAEREDWLRYAAPAQVAVVTQNRKTLEAGGISQLYQLGAAIPLGKVYGSTGSLEAGTRGLLLPQRDAEGWLYIDNCPADFDETLHEGYMPCTRGNFIAMAFKCLGDAYGWGGQDNSVDCSSFVQDVYYTMGLKIPRDADHQELTLLKQVKMTGLSTEARYAALRQQAEPGDLLFKPGHVMMYLGTDASGTPLCIHSTSGYFINEGTGKYVQGVLVSDLTYHNSAGEEAVDGLTSFAGIWY